MKSKEELLNENSVLNEEFFKKSPKSKEMTGTIISFLPEDAFKEGTKQTALSLFAFNNACRGSYQKQRLSDAFVRYVFKGNTNTVEEMLKKHADFKIHQLLGYLASGSQDEAQEILKDHPELLLERGSVIDPSKRYFKNIRPFELVLWTFDVRYMAGMILNCLPKTEEGEKIRKQLILQYKSVEEKGVTYTFENKTVTESHFDVNPFINALDTYNGKNDYDDCIKHWCDVVGKEQLKLPMHVRHHYCDEEESFSPTPEFNKKELKRSLKIFNYITHKVQIWDSKLVGLGEEFGILRSFWDKGASEHKGGRGLAISRYGALTDLKAIRHLYEMRTMDFNLLKEELMKPLQKSKDIENFSNLNF